jgi:hypothetical protein
MGFVGIIIFGGMGGTPASPFSICRFLPFAAALGFVENAAVSEDVAYSWHRREIM